MALSSFTNEDDGTFESGYLIEPHVNKLNVKIRIQWKIIPFKRSIRLKYGD